MSQKLMTQAEREELWKWLQRPIPLNVDPPPDWMIKGLDDPDAFLKYAQSSIALRTKTMELELEKLQVMKDLIATLPGPLP